MTPRVRLHNLFAGRIPDRVPWFGDLDYWATALVQRGQKPPGFQRSAEYIDWHRELGVGFYLQGEYPFQARFRQCEEKTWYDGDLRYHEIRTPIGNLREVWRYLQISCSEAPIERLVKNKHDLDVYRFIYENAQFLPKRSRIRNEEDIGDTGVLVSYLPKTPMMQLVALDAGIETVAYLAVDHPDRFIETLEVIKKALDQAVDLVIGCEAEILFLPENLSSEVVGVSFFDRYVRTHQEDWIRKVHDHKKLSMLHMDGTLRGLLRHESATGVRILEALTPAPVGDIPIYEWESAVGESDTILWGGIPGIYFTPHVNDNTFKEHVIQVLDTMRRSPRFVLGVADQVPPDALESRVRRVADLVEDHGSYID